MTNLSDTLAALSECPCCGAPCEVETTPAHDHRWTDENEVPQRTHHHATTRYKFRTGQLVPVPSVERVARAICSAAGPCVKSGECVAMLAHGMQARAVIAAMQEGGVIEQFGHNSLYKS